MKTVYIVRSTHFTDALYYGTLEDARNIAVDQNKIGALCIVTKREVSEDEYAYLMASMERLDGDGIHKETEADAGGIEIHLDSTSA